MALWLFRRKSRRKRSGAGSPAGDSGLLAGPPRSYTLPEGAVAAAPLSSSPIRRRSVNRKQRSEPNKLQRRARTYSFELGRADSLEIGNVHALKAAGRRATNKSTLPSPHASGALGVGRKSDPSVLDNINNYGNSNLPGEAALDRIPTLYPTTKRDGQHLLPRSKSSKRRKNAHNREREAEIKAMSNPRDIYNPGNDFVPVRPAAEPWTAGRPMRRDTRKAQGSKRYGKDKERRPSDISLPNVESIDSAMSSDSEQIAYVISPLSALAPKPTIRYASQPRVGPPSGGSLLNRFPSQKRKLSMPIPEATLKAHKRVDDLANDMSAGDLRELMERDKRRRERKRQRDEERAERRLARQAEKQRRLEAAQDDIGESAAGPSAAPNLARGVLGREAVGLGIDTTSAVVTSSKRRQSPLAESTPPPPSGSLERIEQQQPEEVSQQQLSVNHSAVSIAEANAGTNVTASENVSTTSSRRRASPVDAFHRPNSIPMSPAEELELPPAPILASEMRRESAPIPARTNSRLRKLMRLKKRLSKSSSLGERDSVERANESITRMTSHSGSIRGPLSWGSLGALFRWGSKAKRGSGPSSFSNLSRDSMAAHSSIQRSQNVLFESNSQAQLQLQSQVPAAGAAVAPSAALPSVSGTKAHPLKVKSDIPKRTLSRFREDLPDFLMSPPASRQQSPEVERIPPQEQTPRQAQPFGNQQTQFFADDDDDESIIATPIAFHQNQQVQSPHDSNSNGTRDTPTSWLQVEENEPSPEPQQSLSLASIDSEGSWLSGRATSRRHATAAQRSLDNVSRSYQQQQPHNRHRHEQSRTSNDTGNSSDQQPLSPASAQLVSAANAAMAASALSPDDEDAAGNVADDEYLSRLARNSTSGASRSAFKRESTGEMRPSSDDEMDIDSDTDNARWGSVKERRVGTLVVPGQTADFMKSREGLMKSVYDGEDRSEVGDSPISPVSLTSPVSRTSSEYKEEEAGLQRATSVNLGKSHARHISAGSAKLLEISPRNSVDAKARSREPLF